MATLRVSRHSGEGRHRSGAGEEMSLTEGSPGGQCRKAVDRGCRRASRRSRSAL